jgi:hypothetical protein
MDARLSLLPRAAPYLARIRKNIAQHLIIPPNQRNFFSFKTSRLEIGAH